MADNLNIKTKLMQHMNTHQLIPLISNITHIRLYLKLVLTYVHFGKNKIINCALF